MLIVKIIKIVIAKFHLKKKIPKLHDVEIKKK